MKMIKKSFYYAKGLLFATWIKLQLTISRKHVPTLLRTGFKLAIKELIRAIVYNYDDLL